ncbi:hypothetical protein VRRI112168_11995 [Vreelandella rituensis]|uniref:Uncharacterized protein n=1 Tax=Vreelandella rituensis TaxID=2282306 RepID=A0A368TWT1_9GAMM|nr:hypothetical protein DU506_13340 [Halomonas rituensis]
MKTIFVLMLGTVALLLAVTAQDSLSVRLFLATVGLALYAVALSPGSSRGELKVFSPRKPSEAKMGEFSDRSQRK